MKDQRLMLRNLNSFDVALSVKKRHWVVACTVLFLLAQLGCRTEKISDPELIWNHYRVLIRVGNEDASLSYG